MLSRLESKIRGGRWSYWLVTYGCVGVSYRPVGHGVSSISDVKHVEPPGERVAYREAGQGPADESISQGLDDDRN
jgi:hypothetical protein